MVLLQKTVVPEQMQSLHPIQVSRVMSKVRSPTPSSSTQAILDWNLQANLHTVLLINLLFSDPRGEHLWAPNPGWALWAGRAAARLVHQRLWKPGHWGAAAQHRSSPEANSRSDMTSTIHKTDVHEKLEFHSTACSPMSPTKWKLPANIAIQLHALVLASSVHQ